MKKKVVLSIAGFDPSCGAGIQEDLKAFTAIGVHGVTVVTCITIQNTQSIRNIFKLPISIIESQFDILLEDFNINFVKTGVLYNKDIVNCVSKKISEYRLKSVIDPVLTASSGDALSDESYVDAIKKGIIPNAYMITPNIFEAQILTNENIDSIDKMKNVCKKLYAMGPEYVLIKGGHLNMEYSNDLLFDGKRFTILSLPKILDKKAHGSGCALSALITGFLALGEIPENAVRKSKHILWNMIKHGYIPGQGSDVLNHSSHLVREIPYYFPTDVHFSVWEELETSIEKIISLLKIKYIPEVGVNIGYALPNANNAGDICAIKGRIVKSMDKPILCGSLAFGASKHIASIILAAISFDSDVRCAMNIKYSGDTLKKCKKHNFKIGSFDREKEPSKKISTMEWGTKQTIRNLKEIPDIIYDKGGENKESMIRILGNTPKDVVNKMSILLNND